MFVCFCIIYMKVVKACNFRVSFLISMGRIGGRAAGRPGGRLVVKREGASDLCACCWCVFDFIRAIIIFWMCCCRFVKPSIKSFVGLFVVCCRNRYLRCFSSVWIWLAGFCGVLKKIHCPNARRARSRSLAQMPRWPERNWFRSLCMFVCVCTYLSYSIHTHTHTIHRTNRIATNFKLKFVHLHACVLDWMDC